jgi:hypothetical protein
MVVLYPQKKKFHLEIFAGTSQYVKIPLFDSILCPCLHPSSEKLPFSNVSVYFEPMNSIRTRIQDGGGKWNVFVFGRHLGDGGFRSNFGANLIVSLPEWVVLQLAAGHSRQNTNNSGYLGRGYS